MGFRVLLLVYKYRPQLSFLFSWGVGRCFRVISGYCTAVLTCKIQSTGEYNQHVETDLLLLA